RQPVADTDSVLVGHIRFITQRSRSATRALSSDTYRHLAPVDQAGSGRTYLDVRTTGASAPGGGKMGEQARGDTMGTLRGDNGGGERPQEGGGLPNLPPEWGTIIIPDDPAELDGEGARIRRVFRREAFRRRWRRRLHLKPQPLRRA